MLVGVRMHALGADRNEGDVLLRQRGAMSTSISPRLRQLTATQGFDGTKWCFGVFEITVSVSPGRSFSRIS
jgi:hypothetical protein